MFISSAINAGYLNPVIPAYTNTDFEPVREQEDIATQSPGSQELALYQEYLRQEVPRIVRGALETAVNSETQQLEERWKAQILEVIRHAQDQAFSNYRATVAPTSAEPPGPLVKESQGFEPYNTLPEAGHTTASVLDSWYHLPPPPDDLESMMALPEMNTAIKDTSQSHLSESGYVSNIPTLFPEITDTTSERANLGLGNSSGDWLEYNPVDSFLANSAEWMMDPLPNSEIRPDVGQVGNESQK
jgi:hypothetical protein